MIAVLAKGIFILWATILVVSIIAQYALKKIVSGVGIREQFLIVLAVHGL